MAQTVTIKASPSQPATAFKDDAALSSINQNIARNDKAKTDEPAKDTKQDKPVASAPAQTSQTNQPATAPSPASGETVKYADLSATTNCRKVETKLQTATSAKQDDSKTMTNTAIMCEVSDGDWKPATL